MKSVCKILFDRTFKHTHIFKINVKSLNLYCCVLNYNECMHYKIQVPHEIKINV